MFSFSITKQLIVFLQALGLGFITGLIYLIMSFIFGIILPRSCRYAVTDTVFCIWLSLSSFSFVLAYNLGKLRLYIILGIIFGAILFFLTLGDILSRLLTRVETAALRMRNIFLYCRKKQKNSEKLNKSIAKENIIGV
ncbi:MAG: spore cortex biosynthesis protein YabQ [Clostridia bacterium]|nr:spore cortex biosynthesis protein YabQ [Clostridia bacterium]